MSIGCSSSDSTGENNTSQPIDQNQPPVLIGNWYRPVSSASWQWQLQGTINTSYNVEVYDIDLFDSSANLIQQLQSEGKKVICYFSAGSYENFRADEADFNRSDLGEFLDGWPDEQWLDIRSDSAKAVMINRLDLAVQKGCDGVEPDNMDGYSNNSGFPLSAEDQLNYNRYIASEAHLRDLSVGLKNTLDLIPQLVEYFDFAVNEQCFEFDECDTLAPFTTAGKAILNAEYLPLYVNDATARNDICVISMTLKMSTLILPLELDDSFRLSCP